ncbi:OsmC family protein [Paludibacterium sp. B53371]|uniref:OsmC family protein n=1 Tax=Paludibacterium sp. B53371 TaxID=2806263 RepID=UPI001C03E104|nr:OsmC family protein [Paludibacterium sp. B53371]
MASVTHLQDNTFLARDRHGHAVLIDADAHGAPCPTELLVMALGACCSTDLVNGLSEAGGQVESCQLTTHETLREAEPRIYTDIELVFDIRAQGVDEALVSQVLAAALQRQCHVCLMLGGSIRLSTRFTLNAG